VQLLAPWTVNREVWVKILASVEIWRKGEYWPPAPICRA